MLFPPRWTAPAAAGRADRSCPMPYGEPLRIGRALVALVILCGASAALAPGLMAQAERLPVVQARPRRAARGPGWVWGLGAAAFLVGAIATGLLVGPVDLGVGAIGRELL